MLVPQFWAEGRAHQPRKGRDGRQVTVRRWGWSDESQEAAQQHADQRAREALARIQSGELQLTRREPKVPYNGAEGVPIREEIVARHGETIITRNSYGALCLNTPNVLFADVDFERDLGVAPGCIGALVGAAAAELLCIGLAPDGYVPLAAILGSIAGAILGSFAVQLGQVVLPWLRGGPEKIRWRRLQAFIERNPSWALRVYRTPAGLRVLATHALFDSQSEEAVRFMRAIGSDPVYVTMCRRQACFRARVSPKPWRTAAGHRLRSRAVWPVGEERLASRTAWVEEYEKASQGYASCRYLDTLGSAQTCPEALEVQRLHDELCKAHSDLPIA